MPAWHDTAGMSSATAAKTSPAPTNPDLDAFETAIHTVGEGPARLSNLAAQLRTKELPADLLALVDELTDVENETDRWNLAYRAAQQAAREGSPVLGAHVEQAAADMREGAL